MPEIIPDPGCGDSCNSYLISHAERSMSTTASQTSRYETFNTWESTACAVLFFFREKNGCLFCREKKQKHKGPKKTGVWIKTDLHGDKVDVFRVSKRSIRELELLSLDFSDPKNPRGESWNLLAKSVGFPGRVCDFYILHLQLESGTKNQNSLQFYKHGWLLEMIQFDEHIFQIGWNHHLVQVWEVLISHVEDPI